MSDPAPPWCLDKYAQRAGWRRLLLAVLVIATAAFGALPDVEGASQPMASMPRRSCSSRSSWCCLPGHALSFWSGFFGFVLGVLRLHPVTLRRGSPADGDVPALRERTAILVPVYNEDPADVCARLEANYRSLEATGRLDAFHFFMLSDTTNAEIAREEALAWSALRERLQAVEAPVLPPPRGQCRQESRQHRRMDRVTRCRLRAHDHPRRRQHHGWQYASCGWRR